MKSELEKIIGRQIKSISCVGGGCIGNAVLVHTSDGEKYFAKQYSSNLKNIARCEVNGLNELKKSNAIRIPEVIAYSDNILVLEFIEQGSKSNNFSEIFGRQFAELHKFSSESFGFYENNFIGSTAQQNLPQSDNWCDFYIKNRMQYQFNLAENNGYVDSTFSKSFDRFIERLPEIISPTKDPPSLLHGDLWGGNYLVDANGEPCLIDPAVYYGHREADLAMTMLFGGFDQKFYSSYDEYFPLQPNFNERIEVYKLYHLMNHLNLFGSSYYHQSLAIIKKFI